MSRTIGLRRRLIALALGVLTTSAFADDTAKPGAEVRARDERAFHEEVVPILNRYCLKCHGAEKPKGKVNLAAFPDLDAVLRDRKTWDKVVENVEAGIMPPEGDLPTDAEVGRLVGWVQAAFSQAGCEIANPGRVTIRRLNRTEYNNTIRDLLAVDFRPADDFPLDDVGYGFDNIGDVLTLPPLLMEKYLNAAEQIATKAIVVPRPNLGASRPRPGRDLEGGEPRGDSARILTSNGEMAADFELPESGEYRLRVRAFGDQAGNEPVKMALRLDGNDLQTFDVRASEGHARTFEVLIHADVGRHRVSVAFLNDFFNPDADDPDQRDRNLIVEKLDVVGPAGPPLWPIADLGARELDGGNRRRGVRSLPSSGEIKGSIDFPADGPYRLFIRAYGDQAGPEPVKMAVRIDGQDAATVDVPATQGEPGTYEVLVKTSQGRHTVALAFLNDYYKPEAEDPNLRGDRNLYVLGLEILGQTAGNLPESHRRLITRNPAKDDEWRDCARAILQPFLSRAYRRPVRDDDVDRLARLVEMARDDGEPFERGVQLAVMAVLVNPNFLYRVELDRRWGSDNKDAGPVRPLNDWELASRLSYFLWSSMPDEELFDLARQKKLQDEAVLEAQVRRMLRDPKARALVANFAGQWLTLRNLDNASPDPRRFRGFDRKLLADMKRETELFFESIKDEDRSILDFLDADYTFLNEPLAGHYGIEDVKGDEFRRVSLPPESHRGGVLTQASILTLTSNPTRTSPVKRGKWILEQVLGTPPPPPPPDVPELKEGRELKGTLRQRMEQHRENPSCAVCHNKLDPLGFGFENFDGVGRWRTEERGEPIDASGTLPGGESFAGVEDLKAFLKAQRQPQFTRALAEKMLTYALGRGLEYYDACAVDTIAERVAADGHRFSRLVVEIVNSDPFRKRTREEGNKP